MKYLLPILLTILLTTAVHAAPITNTTDIMLLDLVSGIIHDNKRAYNEKSNGWQNRICNTDHVRTQPTGAYLIHFCSRVFATVIDTAALTKHRDVYLSTRDTVAQLRETADEYRGHSEYDARFNDYIVARNVLVKKKNAYDKTVTAKNVAVDEYISTYKLLAHVSASWYYAHKKHITHTEGLRLAYVNYTPQGEMPKTLTESERTVVKVIYTALVAITK